MVKLVALRDPCRVETAEAFQGGEVRDWRAMAFEGLMVVFEMASPINTWACQVNLTLDPEINI